MQIDPKTAMYLKIVVGLLTAISTGGLTLTGIVSPDVATHIVAIAASLLVVFGIVSSAYSSSAPGPLAPQDPPIVKAVADGASPKTILALAQGTVNASPAPAAPTEPNSPLQPKG